jgi:hypothetical protein
MPHEGTEGLTVLPVLPWAGESLISVAGPS